jgi:hypothetical protein
VPGSILNSSSLFAQNLVADEKNVNQFGAVEFNEYSAFT